MLHVRQYSPTASRKIRASKGAPTKSRYLCLGPLEHVRDTSEHRLSLAQCISHLKAPLTKNPTIPPRQAKGRSGRPDSLEEADEEERTGDLITIPFVGTFFFFSIEMRAGGKGVGRLSPGALRKVPSCIFSSRWLRRAWSAWASAARAPE